MTDYRKQRRDRKEGDLNNEEIRELESLEKHDDGFKDEETTQKSKKAGAAISPLGGSDAYYFNYDDPYPEFDEVIALQFQNVGKIYWYYYPEGKKPENQVNPGEMIVAYSERGVELAKVLNKSLEEFKAQDKINFIKKGFIRKVSQKDIAKSKNLDEKAKEAWAACKEINKELGINMKIVKVKFTLDDSKAIFYFTANGRIDFRELIKRLAYSIRRRIEMRQIGVRDTTKIMGGLGPCGMELCCARFLHAFAPVSIKMAKDQNLTLNPNKISGICGRLFCCLSYENSAYESLRKEYPLEETEVFDMNLNKKGIVKKLNVIQKTITISFFDPESKYEERVYPKELISKKDNGQYVIKLLAEIKKEVLEGIKPIIPIEKKLLIDAEKDEEGDPEGYTAPPSSQTTTQKPLENRQQNREPREPRDPKKQGGNGGNSGGGNAGGSGSNRDPNKKPFNNRRRHHSNKPRNPNDPNSKPANPNQQNSRPANPAPQQKKDEPK